MHQPQQHLHPKRLKKSCVCILNLNSKLAEEVVKGVLLLAQVLTWKGNKKVLTVAVSIVTTTEVSFRKVLNELGQDRHVVSLEIIGFAR
jgi:hypothetical protein